MVEIDKCDLIDRVFSNEYGPWRQDIVKWNELYDACDLDEGWQYFIEDLDEMEESIYVDALRELMLEEECEVCILI